MTRRMDLTGQRFGKLVAVRFAPEFSKPHYGKWICRCDCGNEKPIGQQHLLRGRTQTNGGSNSCGCEKRTQGGNSHKHPMWWRWHSMIERCEKKDAPNYRNYGARGIKVCDRWHHFPSFIEDMKPSFFEGATLEREDTNGNYEPGNVRWATMKEQNNNRRNTVFIETPWGIMTRSEAARRAGVRLGLFINRHNDGWPMERLFDPANRERAANPIRRNQWSIIASLGKSSRP